MQTDHIDSFADVLRDLIESYTNFPDDLLIDFKEHLGAAYFRVTVNGNDQPVVVGMKGTHIRALTKIVSAVGESRDLLFKLTLTEPQVVAGRKTLPRVAIPAQYDIADPVVLLMRVLGELGIHEVTIDTAKDAPTRHIETPTYRFKIIVRSLDDFARLTVPTGAGPDGPGETLVGALGTLFRARAKKDGVKFDLGVFLG